MSRQGNVLCRLLAWHDEQLLRGCALVTPSMAVPHHAAAMALVLQPVSRVAASPPHACQPTVCAFPTHSYFLKHILHDWSDEKSLEILQTIRRCAPPGARLLLCECALPDATADVPEWAATMDLVVRPHFCLPFLFAIVFKSAHCSYRHICLCCACKGATPHSCCACPCRCPHPR